MAPDTAAPEDVIAQAIRVADGQHTMGAGALGEVAVNALRDAGYKVLLRNCSCSCIICTVLPEPDFEVVFEDD